MFTIGDKIVHPMHGAGVIDSIVERKINGLTREYFVLKLPTNGMVIMVPTNNCDEIGMRGIVDEKKAEEIISLISTIDVDMTQNWNKRYRENILRIKSGDLEEVAKVVKGLMIRDQEHGLSTGERKMLHSAKQILISELVLAKDCSYEEIEDEINTAVSVVNV
ncbi:MAG: CarD family transcriptional regulator [Clostridiales bacterium]|nr:CarD family transcriptional regulator [Clostridiales bacterium]